MNMPLDPAIFNTPYHVRLANTLAVVDLTADATSVKCQVYFETGVAITVEANFDGNHADPYIANPCGYIAMFIGDKENRLRGELDEDTKRGLALAIEQQLVKEHLSRSTLPDSIAEFCY